MSVVSSTPAPVLGVAPRLPRAVRLKRTALATVGFALVAGLLWAKGIPCLFARLFHTPCPGCGSTRACLALFHGDLDGLVRYNPVGPVAALLIALLAGQAIHSIYVHGDARAAGTGPLGRAIKRAVAVVVVIEVVLWIARFFGALGGPVPV